MDDRFERAMDAMGTVAKTVLVPWGEPKRAWTRTRAPSERHRRRN